MRIVLSALLGLAASCVRAELSAATDEQTIPALLNFTQKDLPVREKDPRNLSEIDQVARSRGFDWATVTRRAAAGDPKALKQFFAMAKDVDGAAAESYSGMPTVVYHLAGDAKFAAFLRGQPLSFQMMVRNNITNDGEGPGGSQYFRKYFPETARLLYRLEIVDWPSPDKRYGIRKVFSDEFKLAGSKVSRTELIEQPGGRVVGDLTSGDIGTGYDREGEVLWSPDSKRFALLSIDMTPARGNLFSTPRPAPQRKQTAVYQLTGDSWLPVEIPSSDVPGRASDSELAGAILGHDYLEPLRWSKPAVLILQKHEYYEKLKPEVIGDQSFDSVHPFDRLYEITVTIAPDGKATTSWKLRRDR